MIKSILVLADEVKRFESTLALAVELGQRFAAYLDVLHIRADLGLWPPYVDGSVPPLVIEEIRKAAERASDEREAGLQAIYERISAATNISARWNVAVGPRPDVAAANGRLNDLTVIARTDEPDDETWRKTVDALLFNSGRPLLLLPRQVPLLLGERVALAWNGSAQAAHAVATALPFLRSANQTTVMSAGTIDRDASAHRLIEYLGRHNVPAVSREFEPGYVSIGAALLQHSRLARADLLVMGAYSHSRLREVILGGATREILAEADLPVLMAH
jgi:nucleotide-binding universal stress UspA family protein